MSIFVNPIIALLQAVTLSSFPPNPVSNIKKSALFVNRVKKVYHFLFVKFIFHSLVLRRNII